MVNVCALRCIGKENREKQFHKSEFRRESDRGDEMKDNQNELNANVESQRAKSDICFLLFFKQRFYTMVTVQPLVWGAGNIYSITACLVLKDITVWGLVYVQPNNLGY